MLEKGGYEVVSVFQESLNAMLSASQFILGTVSCYSGGWQGKKSFCT